MLPVYIQRGGGCFAWFLEGLCARPGLHRRAGRSSLRSAIFPYPGGAESTTPLPARTERRTARPSSFRPTNILTD